LPERFVLAQIEQHHLSEFSYTKFGRNGGKARNAGPKARDGLGKSRNAAGKSSPRKTAVNGHAATPELDQHQLLNALHAM
jgi:hypothetical protein